MTDILSTLPTFRWVPPYDAELYAKVVKDLETQVINEDDPEDKDAKSDNVRVRKGRVIINDIARYVQSRYKYVWKDDIFLVYDDTAGVWIESKDFNLRNRITELLVQHIPTRTKNSLINDIRIRLEDIVKEWSIRSAQDIIENENFINFKNGMLDMRTRRLFLHHPDYHSTYQIPYDYSPGAKCEVWLDFLRFAMDGDEELITILQRFIAYVLSSQIDIHRYLHIIGPGGSGKSKFGETVFKLVGPDKSAAIDISDERDGFPLDTIHGKKLLFMDEWEATHLTPQSQKILKQLGAFGILRQRQKQKDGKSIRNLAKLIIASNEFPHISDTTSAIFRRLILVNFSKVIPEHLQNEFFAKTNNFETELPGIIKWALEEYNNVRIMKSQSFEWTAKQREWIEDIRVYSNHIQHWIRDCCDVTSDPATRTSTDILFNSKEPTSYKNWCARVEVNPRLQYNMITFGRKISQALHGRIQSRKNKIGRIEWEGIRLKIASEGF